MLYIRFLIAQESVNVFKCNLPDEGLLTLRVARKDPCQAV